MTTDRGQLQRRWADLAARAGLAGEVDEAGRWLLDAYGAGGRAYHNLDHLAHCLGELDAVIGQCQDPLAVELALWFHDSVYDPARADNEERSADWAGTVLGYLAAPAALVETVQSLVLDTRHADAAAPATPDGRLVADIDLAVLGGPPEAFDAYERAIRREYRDITDEGFRAGRLRVLSRFLERPQIYHTLTFRARYETRARQNVARAIEQLRQPATTATALRGAG